MNSCLLTLLDSVAVVSDSQLTEKAPSSALIMNGLYNDIIIVMLMQQLKREDIGIKRQVQN